MDLFSWTEEEEQFRGGKFSRVCQRTGKSAKIYIAKLTSSKVNLLRVFVKKRNKVQTFMFR